MPEICLFTLVCAGCEEVYGFYRMDDSWGDAQASDLEVFKTEVSHEDLDHHWVIGQVYIGHVGEEPINKSGDIVLGVRE